MLLDELDYPGEQAATSTLRHWGRPGRQLRDACRYLCPATMPAGAGKPDPRTGHIVVGVQTQEAVGLIKYSCSSRVIPMPTAFLNARRCVTGLQSFRLAGQHGSCMRAAQQVCEASTLCLLRRISRNIQSPVLTYVSNNILNFRSQAQGYLMHFPQLYVRAP